jgi:hypothetical protein
MFIFILTKIILFIKLDWTAFIIKGVFKDVKNVTINESEKLIVDDFNYIKFIAKLIRDYENSTNKVYYNV